MFEFRFPLSAKLGTPLCRNTSRFSTHDNDIGIDFWRAIVNVNSKVKHSERECVKFA